MSWKSSQCTAAARLLAAVLVLLPAGVIATAQNLSVLPVNVFLSSGQRATSLSVTNTGKNATAIQIRAFDWSQKDDADQLTPSNVVIASPPFATIAPGATQIVRLVLRQLPRDREATYRILIDQIPPPGEAGVVHIVLRLSIPIFALPESHVTAQLQFHVEQHEGKVDLVAVNSGSSHEVLRDVVLTTSGGLKLKTESGVSPYILAGVTRRWHLDAQGHIPHLGDTLQLTARTYAATLDQQVQVSATP